jgi:cellulose synthase (UDP-forming)
LDADFIASSHLIDDMIGHFLDPMVAFVQAPQVFYNTNSFQHGSESSLWNEQSLFYDVIQPGKNHWNAAFWCGSPAILRRSALDDVGGVAVDSVTEDISTSVRLHSRGWRSVYHVGLVAAGIAPEDFDRYYRQRLRWVRGGNQVFRSYLIRWRRNSDQLSLTQRLAYLGSAGKPWDVLRQLAFYSIPPLVAFTGAIPVHNSRYMLIIFGVIQAFIFLGTIALSRGTYRLIHSQLYDIIFMLAGFRAMPALWRSTAGRFDATAKGGAGLRKGRLQPRSSGSLSWTRFIWRPCRSV